MRQHTWTDSQTALLVELYPVETTAHTAEALGMSETAVKNKARELGIGKLAKTTWMERAEHVRNHFHEHSYAEIARDLGISKMSVSRMAAQLGLKRSNRERFSVCSRIRRDMIRRERRRVVFGLEPITNIKVVSNRPRVRLRSVLKRKGYVIGEDNRTLYYTDGLCRNELLESHGQKLGLKFFPLPARTSLDNEGQESEPTSSNAI